MSELPLLVRVGVVELTVGVLSGWLMVYASDKARRERGGIVAGQRIRQGHIDLLMMGTILVAIGAAVPDPPILSVALIVVGSIVAPLLFFPLAWKPDLGDNFWLRWLDRTGFVSLTAGYVVLAAAVLSR